MNDKHFLIIGSQGSGSALMRGLLNAHSKIMVEYEWVDMGIRPFHYLQWGPWADQAKKAEKKGLIWGNRIVFQPIWDAMGGQHINVELIAHINEFKMIWPLRRKGKLEGRHPRSYKLYELMIQTYLSVKNAYPARIILVSFEDLILRTEAELIRICNFLDVQPEWSMLEGTKDTGHAPFNYGKILKEKV